MQSAEFRSKRGNRSNIDPKVLPLAAAQLNLLNNYTGSFHIH